MIGGYSQLELQSKGIQHFIISCKNFILKLEKGTNNNNCKKYCNWDVERAKHSEKLVNSVSGHVKKPRNVLLKLQQKERKKHVKM